MTQPGKRTFTVKWLADDKSWGVLIREGRHAAYVACYCNEVDSEDKARKHAARLESEYQPGLFE